MAVRTYQQTIGEIWSHAMKRVAIAVLLFVYGLYVSAQQEWPEQLSWHPLSWLVGLVPPWLILLAAVAFLLWATFSWAHERVSELESGPQIEADARFQWAWIDVNATVAPPRSFRIHSGIYVKIWSEASGRDALTATRVVPWLTYYHLDGKAFTGELRSQWVRLMRDSAVMPQGEPDKSETVDLEPNRIPAFVMLVEQQIPPLFSGTGVSIPNGSSTFIHVERGDNFLVKVRLSGNQLAPDTQWWFLVRFSPPNRSDGEQETESQGYELTVERVPPPPSVMPYQWAEWTQ
ncbi:MAG: hypothetical protein U0236_23410 [Nitrospira sp.]